MDYTKSIQPDCIRIAIEMVVWVIIWVSLRVVIQFTTVAEVCSQDYS